MTELVPAINIFIAAGLLFVIGVIAAVINEATN